MRLAFCAENSMMLVFAIECCVIKCRHSEHKHLHLGNGRNGREGIQTFINCQLMYHKILLSNDVCENLQL